jgi:hypothetical protein
MSYRKNWTQREVTSAENEEGALEKKCRFEGLQRKKRYTAFQTECGRAKVKAGHGMNAR